MDIRAIIRSKSRRRSVSADLSSRFRVLNEFKLTREEKNHFRECEEAHNTNIYNSSRSDSVSDRSQVWDVDSLQANQLDFFSPEVCQSTRYQ